MSKVAKGEWRIIHEPFLVSVESDDDIIYERYLSDVHDQDAIDELQEALATAALVCAAPDLLEALQSIIINADPRLFSDGQLEQAKRAIAKALTPQS